MRRLPEALGALVLAGLVAAGPVLAQETGRGGTKDPNKAPRELAARAKNDAADRVAEVHLAHGLIRYGKANKDALALVTAAP